MQQLSDIETKVLHMLALGATYTQSAEMLGVTPHVVRNRLKTVYRKLRALNGPHAVAIGITMDLIPPIGYVTAGEDR